MKRLQIVVPVYVALTLGFQAIGRFANIPVLYNASLIMAIPLFILALWLAPVRLLKMFSIMIAMFVAFAVTAFIPGWLYAEFIFRNADNRTLDMIAILACIALGLTAGFITGKKLNEKLGGPLND